MSPLTEGSLSLHYPSATADLAQVCPQLLRRPADDHAFAVGSFKPVVQISTDGFAADPEAVDHAFGPYPKYGTIINEYKNASMIYSHSEMGGTHRTPIGGIGESEKRTICTGHVERLNGTQRVFMKRLNRLTLCFSKKLENPEAALGMFAAYCNFAGRLGSRGKAG